MVFWLREKILSVECHANIPPLSRDLRFSRSQILDILGSGGQKISHFWYTIRSIYKGKSTHFERNIAKIFLPAAQNDLILTMTQIAPKARRKIRIFWLYLRCKSRRRREENFGISGLHSNEKLSKICQNPGSFWDLANIPPPLDKYPERGKGEVFLLGIPLMPSWCR